MTCLRQFANRLTWCAILMAAFSGTASAQTFNDPVMRIVRVVATCEGPTTFGASVALHFHTFGSPTVGRPREISPPPLLCTSEEPSVELAMYLAVPMIWHAYVHAPDGLGSESRQICEVEGQGLPTANRCPASDGAVTFDIAEVPE